MSIRLGVCCTDQAFDVREYRGALPLHSYTVANCSIVSKYLCVTVCVCMSCLRPAGHCGLYPAFIAKW